MSDIEVVREALASRWGGDYRFPGMPEQLWKDANAALDSLEAELAQVRDLRAAAEQERDSLIEGNAWLDRELREVREERDAARNHLLREGMERDRYREALERIERGRRDGRTYSDLLDIADAALTGETEPRVRITPSGEAVRLSGEISPRIRAYPDEIEGGTEADAHVFHAEADGTIPDAYPVAGGDRVTIVHPAWPDPERPS